MARRVSGAETVRYAGGSSYASLRFYRRRPRGSMARAAADLGITQPSVSEIITNLEHATGMRLLDRGPRGVTPTNYGEILLRGGNAAIDDLRQSIKEMQFLADPSVGDVRIGCPETVAALMPPILKRLARKHSAHSCARHRRCRAHT